MAAATRRTAGRASVTLQDRVVTDDGVGLHVEIEDGPGPTLVLCHGYCLNLHSWDRQWEALRGRVRLVRWDQRGHGRSERGPAGSESLERLGTDLGQVVDAVAPAGPVVLVGHSMGGMTVLALAAQRPELFTDRVTGVGLIATSSGGLAGHGFGLGCAGRNLMRWGPPVVRWSGRYRRLGASERSVWTRLEQNLTWRWSYAAPVPAELRAFTTGMLVATAPEVTAAFMPMFALPPDHWSLAPLAHLPVLIVAGTADRLIPPEHSERMAAALPLARLVMVRRAGHLVMLEHPDILNRQLSHLLQENPSW